MIITLCGSARFEKEFHHWNEFLSVEYECVVYSLSVFPSMKNGIKAWYTEKTKATLDRVHKKKILVSDAIFIITGIYSTLDRSMIYIGESTSTEISFATGLGKRVFYDFDLPRCLKAIREYQQSRRGVLI